MYAAGCLTAAVGLALAHRLPGPVAPVARAGAVAAAALLATGTAATWWVYDRSELRTFDWLEELLPTGPGAHLVVSSGLDETSRPVAARWPGHPQTVVDLYHPALMTEGSIRRARRRVPPVPGTLPGRPDRLPAATGSADTVLAVFAAHELRRPDDRHALFAEFAPGTAPRRPPRPGRAPAGRRQHRGLRPRRPALLPPPDLAPGRGRSGSAPRRATADRRTRHRPLPHPRRHPDQHPDHRPDHHPDRHPDRKAPHTVTHLLTLDGQLRLVGAALIAMGALHLVLPRLIGWPADLAGTTLLTRQVSYVHLFFIALTCVLLGLLPLLLTRDLLAGGRLGTALLAAQTLFWGTRWIFEFAVFSPKLWRGDRLRTAAHATLSVLWTWVTAVFACALGTALGG
ncbi:hypothetical protein [Kitasatospora fiedleri]|uniref:hypothetical protein n=1 Tax=Kitasatospora fiedleri TaxID=2991545 RepID=UPI00249AB546|nr:hypothetical protein [Kitasatospora fiedleri]